MKSKMYPSQFVSGGKTYSSEYIEVDSFSDFDYAKCKNVSGVCFYEGKLIVVYDPNRDSWGLPGGKPEKGETPEQTLKREVIEETNTTVIKWLPLAVQKIINEEGDWIYQYRACCKVDKIGDFKSDPGGPISKVEFINPADYTQYFDWGQNGEMIIARSLKLISSI